VDRVVVIHECSDEAIEFSLVRWTWTPSNPSLNFEVNGHNGDIVINERGTFFIYAQVRADVLFHSG